ncbi:PIN domain-containing protein [Horticoccus luteus]|uniref:PIN domain-containing protein n=1 Tax=Horticoccus luteus TaxID=2862869 RepID=A0A8F9XJX8_9BACT|nr:PIN domain-containing protein [Horticoccus luteus]QYM77621.1 PIN domain-containing protein [Horticoccus luteus]
MRLFLDTSVLFAAAGSARGASRFVITQAATQGWELVSSYYCEEETRRNLAKVGATAARGWKQLAPLMRFVQVSVALDQPLVFPKAKDRPVVITALATRADWLLTLDEGDFHEKLGREVYGLRLATPGEFLLEQRAHGVL